MKNLEIPKNNPPYLKNSRPTKLQISAIYVTKLVLLYYIYDFFLKF
jgi:hypothetical protein